VLERASRHLREIEALERAAADAAADADYQRRRKRLGWGILQPLFPLVFGLLVTSALMLGIASQFAVIPLLTPVLGEQAGGMVGGLFGLCLGAALVASLTLLRARRRKIAVSLPAVEIGRVECTACGAGVPVLYHRPTACPFCTSDLLVQDRMQSAERGVAERELRSRRADAAVARAGAERAHADQSESVVGAVLSTQLAVVVFGIVVAVILVVIKLLFHV
jgi:hypothetical protein